MRDSPDTSATPVLRLSLFGPMTATWAGQELRIKGLKARAALAYIALSEGRLETRERLVGLLWSESGEDKARASLRQTLRELRQVCADVGFDGLRTEWREVELDQDSVEVDVATVLDQAERHEVHPWLLTAQRLADSLLAGLEDLDPAFRVWLLAKRRTLQDSLLRSLEAGMRNTALDEARRSRLAEAIINLDPTHEEACRHVMQAKAAAGDTAGALRVYKTLWDVLDEDYGMEPAAATQKLVADIKTGNFEPPLPAASSGPGSPTPPGDAARAGAAAAGELEARMHATRLTLSLHGVAIQSVEPDKAHLVLGFRQILFASLVRFREWFVTDATFQDPASGSPDGTGGHYELQMFAQQSGPAVQLTLMLRESETGVFIWSDGFELRLENWFDSQRRVVHRVAMALNVHLSAERLRRFSDQPNVPLSLYDRWLRAQTLVRTFNPKDREWLRQQFLDIIDEAPEFAPAWCGLADLHSIEHLAFPGILRTPEREQQALECARKAVQLDPADMRAHRTLAWAHMMARQFTQAEMHMEVAWELNPNDSWSAISVALQWAFLGRHRIAPKLARQALDMRLVPSRTHWAFNVDIQFLSGNYQLALDAAERAQDVLWTVPAWRAAALAHLGRQQEAAAVGQRFLSRVRANWFGSEPATDEAIVRWVLHLYPFRRREDWQRLRDGLLGAGLPTDGMDYQV